VIDSGAELKLESALTRIAVEIPKIASDLFLSFAT
jgi:hypothetical protein